MVAETGVTLVGIVDKSIGVLSDLTFGGDSIFGIAAGVLEIAGEPIFEAGLGVVAIELFFNFIGAKGDICAGVLPGNDIDRRGAGLATEPNLSVNLLGSLLGSRFVRSLSVSLKHKRP